MSRRPAANPAPGATVNRRLLLVLAALSLGVAWLNLTALSGEDPWYNNAEMNVHNLVDALAINADVVPGRVDQPGFTAKYLLALDYRVRHYLGSLPVWNLRKFGAAADPLPELARLIHLGRTHSQILVFLFILTAAGLVYAVTRSPDAALLALIVLCASSGLLFHGLVNRPDLLCTWFGTVLTSFLAWRAGAAGSAATRHVWLFLAGLAAGLAILTKLPGLTYLVVLSGWCWLVPGSAVVPAGRHRLTAFILPIASSAALFWVMIRLVDGPEPLSPVALTRLRLLAAAVGTLPWLALYPGRSRFGAFLQLRGVELALVFGGALAAVSLGYGALCAVMSPSPAAEYLAAVLQFVVHPDPQMKYLLAATPNIGREFLLFVRESPLLFLSAGAATLAVALSRTTPYRLKVFIALLFVQAIAMTWLLSHRYFLDQFSLYAQVPLQLVCVLSLFCLGVWRQGTAPAGRSWAGPAVITGAAVLVATVYLRLEPKHRFYRTETAPPVSQLTLTYLYNHEAHPARYREIMAEHYGTREQFAVTLEQYLADPAHRR